jgi:GNAT superfamily N-acetyltransferase
MGDPGLPLAAAADVVHRFYAERDRPAMVQVELGSANERELGELGWDVVPGGDAHFLLAPLAEVLARAGSDADTDVELDEDLPQVRAGRVVDGAEVAAARGAVDHGWLAVHGLVVEPAYRRRGHAAALMAALLRWRSARGATTGCASRRTTRRPGPSTTPSG